jgi:hypothetical protein
MPPTDRGGAQRALARVYERLGSRIVLALILAAWAVTIVTSFLMAVAMDGYLDVARADFWFLLAFAEGCAIAGPAIVMFQARDVLRAILAWSGRARTAENAPAAWHAVATYPVVICRRGLPLAGLLVVIATAVTALVLDSPAWAIDRKSVV